MTQCGVAGSSVLSSFQFGHSVSNVQVACLTPIIFLWSPSQSGLMFSKAFIFISERMKGGFQWYHCLRGSVNSSTKKTTAGKTRGMWNLSHTESLFICASVDCSDVCGDKFIFMVRIKIPTNINKYKQALLSSGCFYFQSVTFCNLWLLLWIHFFLVTKPWNIFLNCFLIQQPTDECNCSVRSSH